MLKLSDFDYLLPKELIAQYPLKERDSARLLVLDRKIGTVEHRSFKDILEYFNPGDLLVLNDTKVLPSRLMGRRQTGGKAEVLLLKVKSGLTFSVLISPARIKIGEKLNFNGGKVLGEITAKNEITFNTKDITATYSLGVMPLPPYIKRPPEGSDNIYYQTVYAKNQGSVASPTAGLHFTEELIGKIESKGVNIAYITLHIGISTFKPVKAADISGHRMEPESFNVPGSTVRLIEKARLNKKRIFAVGTTSCRALEAWGSGKSEGITDLFVYPGYKFNTVACLMTNFHLPRTTLFMLACAFAGNSLIRKAYQEAIDKEYRFYSYGDAMLII